MIAARNCFTNTQHWSVPIHGDFSPPVYGYRTSARREMLFDITATAEATQMKMLDFPQGCVSTFGHLAGPITGQGNAIPQASDLLIRKT